MDTVKDLIGQVTGLSVEVLTSGHDSKEQLYYACCLFDAELCYVGIADDKSRFIICTDDKTTIDNISRILGGKEKRNVTHDTTIDTEYYMYDYILKGAINNERH